MNIYKESEKLDRCRVLLKATYDLLYKQTESPFVLNILEEIVTYDGADCDGHCLMDDIADELMIIGCEDICRSMISSYNSDKLTYEQYKDSDNEEKQSWAEEAKMRANKTASTYNNYILKNEYIWRGNVPSDIYMTLEYITE